MAEILNHAIHRLMERTDQEVSRKEIIRGIENRSMIFAKKMTNSRSLVYVITPSGVVKVILHKPTGKVITVLPWKSKYYKLVQFNSIKGTGWFQVDMYPDCFVETNCKTALTKIIRIHLDGAKENIGFNHPLFEEIFTEAWKLFRKEENEIKTENSIESTKYATEVTTTHNVSI